MRLHVYYYLVVCSLFLMDCEEKVASNVSQKNLSHKGSLLKKPSSACDLDDVRAVKIARKRRLVEKNVHAAPKYENRIVYFQSHEKKQLKYKNSRYFGRRLKRKNSISGKYIDKQRSYLSELERLRRKKYDNLTLEVKKADAKRRILGK